MRLPLSDYDYELPAELIAQTPAEPRDSSRLLVLDRAKTEIAHRVFRDLGDYLSPGDLLVANQSRVLPGRLLGTKRGTGAHVELLLLAPLEGGRWRVLAKPARRLHPGQQLDFADGELTATVEAREEEGQLVVSLATEGDLMSILERLGRAPLPPYIHGWAGNPDRYQTVYARERGSAAAPTAGLHFTRELMDRLLGSGVGFGFVTLHIGLDTFRPISVEDAAEHKIHTEWMEVTPELAAQVRSTKAAGRRVIAVGTTSVRALESAAEESGVVTPYRGSTGLYITPGRRFRAVDGMITNFHLPRSSLLLLVSAFAGRDRVLSAYRAAVERRYRFYSFGDAMLLL